jgi:hypothetical protein
MKRMILPLLLVAIGCSACSTHYIMKLTNGTEITTGSKPKLKGGNYIFKDALGKENHVSQGRVREILPASMAKKEQNQFIPASR